VVKVNILVTCPPMLSNIEKIIENIDSKDINFTAVDIDSEINNKDLSKLLYNKDSWIIGDELIDENRIELIRKFGLKSVIKWGVGTDNVNIQKLQEYAIKFSNTPNHFGEEVSDLAIGYLIGLSRHIGRIDRNVRKGIWDKPTGKSLQNKIIGVVGLGNIGSKIVKKLKVFNVQVYGYDIKIMDDELKDLNILVWPEGIEKLDYIILSCPLTNETKHIVNSSTIEKMKKGVRIINVSRGGLIDENELLLGLKNNIINSVALDVYEKEPLSVKSELLEFQDNIYGTHNASNTFEAVLGASVEAIQIAINFNK
jgi:D-3-phosphoglycerate dehydrogenase